MKKLILVAVIAALSCGCDPKVIVSDDWDMHVGQVDLDEDACGDFVGITKTETESNYVITVTFNKKEMK